MSNFSYDVLWTQFWQVSMLILIVAGLNAFLRSKSPHLASLLWLVVLFKCLTPPVVSSPSSLFSWIQPAVVGRSESSVELVDLKRKTNSANAYQIRYEDGDQSSLTPTTENPILRAEVLAAVANNGEVSSKPKSIPGESPSKERNLFSTKALGICWLAGFTIVLSWTLLRYALFRNAIRKTIRVDRDLNQIARRLCRKLRVRRDVTVWITTSNIGPAVIGFFKPVIVLPDVIVAKKSRSEIEPILAHEINHLRRGDTLYGVFQIMVLCCWWFHPLIWLIDRMITRDIERCCDESTIARFNYSPVEYARCLLDVVQLKQLKPVPSSPGVRRIDITRKRLEKIMKLRQGSRNTARSRASLICWLLAISLAAATIPGAAFVTAQDSDATPTDQVERTTNPNPVQNAAKKRDEKFVVRTYDVNQALSEFAQYFDFETATAARPAFKNFIRNTACPLRREQITFQGIHGRVVTALKEEPSRVVWVGNRLRILETEERHLAIERVIKIAKSKKFDQFVFDIVVITTNQAVAKKIGLLDSKNRQAEGQTDSKAAAPSLMIVKDLASAKELGELIRQSKKSQIVSTPRVTTWFETKCSVSAGAQHSYPVMKDGKRVGSKPVFVGHKIELQVKSGKKPQDIHVELNVSNTRLGDSPVKSATPENDETTTNAASPCVFVRRLSTTAKLAPGHLLVSGIDAQTDDDSGEYMLVLLSVTRLSKAQKADPQSTRLINQVRNAARTEAKPIPSKVDLSDLSLKTYPVGDIIDGYREVLKTSPQQLDDGKTLEQAIAEAIQVEVGRDAWPDETAIHFDKRSRSMIVNQSSANHGKVRYYIAQHRFVLSHRIQCDIRTYKLSATVDFPDEVFEQQLSQTESILWEHLVKNEKGVEMEIIPNARLSLRTVGGQNQFNPDPEHKSNNLSLSLSDLDSPRKSQTTDQYIGGEPVNAFVALLEFNIGKGDAHKMPIELNSQTDVLLDVSDEFGDRIKKGERAVMRLQFKIGYDQKAFKEYKKLHEMQIYDKKAKDPVLQLRR